MTTATNKDTHLASMRPHNLHMQIIDMGNIAAAAAAATAAAATAVAATAAASATPPNITNRPGQCTVNE
jgi:hypothetical protein